MKLNEIIDDSYKIINPLQEVMNFATKDEVIIYSENSEDESNDPQRNAASPKINTPEITTPVINTTQQPQESGINVTKAQIKINYSVKC